MAIKTKMRLAQITGSFSPDGSDAKGSIVTQAGTATLAQINVTGLDLSGSLSHMASAIQRIHGKASGEFANAAAGEFYQDIKIIDAGGLTLGAGGDEFSITESSDNIAIKSLVQDKDMTFHVNDGGVDTEIFRLDNAVGAGAMKMAVGKAIQLGSGDRFIKDAGDDILITSGGDVVIGGTSAKLEFGSANSGEHITGNDTDLTIASGGKIVLSTSDLDLSGGATDVTVVDNNANALSFDAAGQADILKIDSSNGSEKVIVHALDVTNDITVTGNLTVNGTTTTLDVANLSVEDPFILLGDGAQAANANAGIIFVSGSNTGASRPDVSFARAANDVWALGSIASNSGSITSATGATMDIALKVGSVQIFESTTSIKQTSNSMHLESDESILLDSKDAGATEFRFGGVAKGKMSHSSSDLVLSASVASLSLRSATGGVDVFDTHDGSSNPRQVANLAFDADMTQGSAFQLGTSAYGGLIKTIGGNTLSLSANQDGYIELGVDDNSGNAFLALSGSGANVTMNIGAGDGSDGFVAKEGALTLSGSALVLDNGASGNEALLKFKSNNSNFVQLAAPAGLAGTYTLTLPPNDGNSSDVLQTDGSGVLTWVPQGGASAAIKKIGTVSNSGNGHATNAEVNFNTAAHFAEAAAVLNVSTVDAGARYNAIDVYVNGQLLSSGTSAPGSNVTGGDYVLVDNAGSGAGSAAQATLKFAFDLETEDIVSVVIRA